MFNEFIKPLIESKKVTLPEPTPKNISEMQFPKRTKEDLDHVSLRKYRFIQKVATSIRSSYDKLKSKKKANTIKNINVLVSSDFKDWQKLVMNYFVDKEIQYNERGKCIKPLWQKDIKGLFTGDLKSMTKKGMEYSSYVLSNYKEVGAQAFDVTMTIDEKSLLKEHNDYIMKDMAEELVIVIRTTDELSPEENKKLGRCLNSCVPGNPYIYFEFNQVAKKKK
jgi:hypothetical protein